MPTLHIINTSPTMRSSLQSCLRVAQKNDAIILIEDAVITAKDNAQWDEAIKQVLHKFNVFVLKADLQARGISPDQITQGISLVDYNDFVKLTVKYNNLQSWN